MGSFLRNDSELDLGVRQDNVRVNHVILPRWAHNSPAEFILKMRDALESSYVSENLHKWIDLIFGYAQRGDEALKADNLFYYLCYEGAVDLDEIKDYSERKSLELQIQEFGQIPSQLFDSPHLPKLSVDLTIETKVFATVDEKYAVYARKWKSTVDEKKIQINTAKEKVASKNSHNKLSASTFQQLTLKLSIKLHSSQINDCIFIEQDPKNESTTTTTIESNSKRSINLPLICSVSNDAWIKIYSLEDRSLFRSHNVSNFSLSSVDCLRIKSNSNSEINSKNDSFFRTLLFLSCWDNSMYIYDMNYNRCIHTLSQSHDDALSRVRLVNNRRFILTSSWDSSIKVWTTPSFKSTNTTQDCLRIEYLTELAHDSAVVDFYTVKDYLASLCQDGNLYLWKMSVSETATDPELFTFFYTIQSSADIGKIKDCKMVDSTLAVCTSLGFVKIFNIETNSELFSLKVASTNLNKIFYTTDFIITCSSCGHVYFIDLLNDLKSNSFLSHTIKLTDNSLETLCIYKEMIICLGDSEGFLYFLSLCDI
jgi:factor associated with neutral sphingomyelinase activation